MKQPVRGKGRRTNNKNQKPRSHPFKKRKHNEEYGTSKLELDFAREFLDRLGLKYVYQFEAKDIKRYYDFAVTVYDDYPSFKFENKNGLKSIIQEDRFFLISFFIEVDGDYYHANPQTIDENKLNPMQKHNKYVDKLKNEWALQRGIPLLRFWEYDIRNNPSKVMKELEKELKKSNKKKIILENKKKPH